MLGKKNSACQVLSLTIVTSHRGWWHFMDTSKYVTLSSSPIFFSCATIFLLPFQWWPFFKRRKIKKTFPQSNITSKWLFCIIALQRWILIMSLYISQLEILWLNLTHQYWNILTLIHKRLFPSSKATTVCRVCKSVLSNKDMLHKFNTIES